MILGDLFTFISLKKFAYKNVILLVSFKKIRIYIIFSILLVSLKKINIVCGEGETNTRNKSLNCVYFFWQRLTFFSLIEFKVKCW